VTSTSPRLDPRLAAAAVALDNPGLPIAETWRKVCAEADRLSLPLPGYDTIRLVVRARRQQREEIRQLLEPVVVDALRGRLSPWDLDRIVEATLVARGSRASKRH
jgi:hypothetical protein